MDVPSHVRLMEENRVKYAVLPYDKYLALSRFELFKQTRGIPNQIVGDVMLQQVNLVLAWRRYLNLTEAELAARMGISQPALAQIENASRPRKVTLKKVAQALGLQIEQLLF